MIGRSGATRSWWRRARWRVAIAAIATVLTAGGIALAVLWSNRGAEQASVEEAVEGLDDGGRGGEAGTLAPATGVYVYEGDGTESISVLDTSQQWGPSLPASVQRDARGCWTLTIQYNTHHEQSTTYCPRGDVLEETGGSTSQSFDFAVTTVDDVNTFVCEPPGETIRVNAAPGSTWPQSCSGHSERRGTNAISAGSNTFIGVETTVVGDVTVRAYHYRAVRKLTGDQAGRDEVETWYRVRDALPVRVERDTRVESPSPVGTVTYTEHGTYALSSLEPRR